MSRSRPVLALVLLSLVWGLGPALPALSRGDLIGQPFTDLYPSVWGLWQSAQSSDLFASHTALLGFPEGMGFAFSSPLKGALARLLMPSLGPVWTFNLLTLLARVGTVLAAGAAARAWGASHRGALVAAAVYGCAPFFHGYAVEGIIEGTDGWTLALWLWAVGRGRTGLAIPLLALTLVSSWYLGAAALLLCVLMAPWRPGVLWSLLGVALAWPALHAFGQAFPGVAAIDPAVRAAMGTSLQLRPPGLLAGLQPLAMTSWIGLIVPILVITGRQRLALLALIPFVLSLGEGPWYALPGLDLLRFPYRLHAATLAILALASARAVDGLDPTRRRWGWLAPLIVVEGLLLSPIEPVLPGAPTEIPALYRQVDGPLLVLPGPVALPPGQVNPSRPRARSFLYFQTLHGQPSPWRPDFNSVGTSVARSQGDEARSAAWATALLAWDPILAPRAPDGLAAGTVASLRQLGVTQIMVEHDGLGRPRSRALVAALLADGALLQETDGERTLLRVGSAISVQDR